MCISSGLRAVLILEERHPHQGSFTVTRNFECSTETSGVKSHIFSKKLA